MKKLFTIVVFSILFVTFLACCYFIFYVTYIDFKTFVDSKSADGNASNINQHSFKILQQTLYVGISFLIGLTILFRLYHVKAFRFVFGFIQFLIDKIRNSITILQALSTANKLALAGIMILGIILRLTLLNYPITYDEAFSYNNYISKGYLNILGNYSYPNNHVLYNIFAKLSTTTFGLSNWSVRLPSLLFGILLIPSIQYLSFLFANKSKRPIVFVSALLVCVSPILIEYSVLARGYVLILLLITWSFITTLKYLKTKNHFYLCILIFLNSLAMWAIPIAAFPILASYLYLLYITKWIDKKIYYSILLNGLLILLLYSPIWLISGFSILVPAQEGSHGFARLFEYEIWHGCKDFYYNYVMTKPLFFTYMAIATLVSMFYSKKLRLLISFFFISSIILIFIQKQVPPARVWIAMIIPFVLANEVFWNHILRTKQKWIGGSFIILFVLSQYLLFGSKTFVMSEFRYPQAKEIVSEAKEHSSANAVTILSQFPMEAAINFELNKVQEGKANKSPSKFYLVVSNLHQQTILSVCKKLGIDSIEYKIASVTDKETYKLYLFEKFE